ncbi:hypothetical protein OsJ_22305 [Oryza sativa Japonica Group]|uniref:Lon N-terminal domain-containing protein n=1 Tax=Oryza sativa subsp. japonica TaxID=39947 RepID=B9FQE7_ORYSJ|nr:hypothetical protein OsJ_22305 [Oryza sativa Japonica Group]
MAPSSNLTQAARAVHKFNVNGYSATKAMAKHEHVSSKRLTVAGYAWEIHYTPGHDAHWHYWVAFKLVLIPSECKTLHLYEARYLALLEEALYRTNNSFVHLVLDPVVSGSPKASFAVERLDIGALVSIRGVCRVNIINLLQMEPYLRGDVSPIMDISSESIELGLRISKLRESMCNLHSLQMKLKVPEDEPLQTNIKASLLWSEKEIFEEYNEGFIPALPERLSFAAYQTVSGMSEAELLSLQKYKIQAMDSTNTLERLNSGIEYVEHNIGMIAARLAIQNI